MVVEKVCRVLVFGCRVSYVGNMVVVMVVKMVSWRGLVSVFSVKGWI